MDQLISKLNSDKVTSPHADQWWPLSLFQIYPNRAIVGIIEAFSILVLLILEGQTWLMCSSVRTVLGVRYQPLATCVLSGQVPPAVDYGMSTPPGRIYLYCYYQNAPLFAAWDSI